MLDNDINPTEIPLWVANTHYEIGDLRICPEDGLIYRHIEQPAISPQARNSRIPPSQATRFWECLLLADSNFDDNDGKQ